MTKEFVSIQIGKIDHRPQASGRLRRHPQNERIGVDVGDLLRRHHQKRPENIKFDNLVIENRRNREGGCL